MYPEVDKYGERIKNNKLINKLVKAKDLSSDKDKLLLFLLPTDHNFLYINEDSHFFTLYNDIIKQRYRDKGYQIAFISFWEYERPVQGVDVLKEDKFLFCYGYDPYETYCFNKPDNKSIVSRITNLNQYDKVTVCGYHVGDCVLDLALKLKEHKDNVSIDADMTELAYAPGEKRIFKRFEYDYGKPLDYELIEDFDPANYNLQLGKNALCDNLIRNMSEFYDRYGYRLNTVLNLYGFSYEDKLSMAADISSNVQEKYSKYSQYPAYEKAFGAFSPPTILDDSPSQ